MRGIDLKRIIVAHCEQPRVYNTRWLIVIGIILLICLLTLGMLKAESAQKLMIAAVEDRNCQLQEQIAAIELRILALRSRQLKNLIDQRIAMETIINIRKLQDQQSEDPAIGRGVVLYKTPGYAPFFRESNPSLKTLK
jgi:hypothetical protein